MPQFNSLHMAMERLSRSAREAQDRWMASLQVAANGNWLRQAEQTYHSNLDTAERLVDQSLELQATLLQNWRQALEALPGSQAQTYSSGWMQLWDRALSQRSALWQRWFDSAREADFGAAERLLEARDPAAMMEVMSKLSQEALNRQLGWLESVLPAAQEEPAGEEEASVVVRPVKAKSAAKVVSAAAEA